jgi:hypothetical protein
MNAKEMFEKLGYDEARESELFITYFHKLKATDLRIMFNKEYRDYACMEKYLHREITLPEHLAIHQQMIELGWIEK